MTSKVAGAPLDRMDVRRAVGEAVLRMNKEQSRAIDEIDDERSRLHKRWQDLQQQANAARDEMERCRPRFNHAADIQLLEKLLDENPDLRVVDPEMTPHICPVVCAATGLGIFEGDAVIGESEYGEVVLKAAVQVVVDPIEGFSP